MAYLFIQDQVAHFQAFATCSGRGGFFWMGGDDMIGEGLQGGGRMEIEGRKGPATKK